MAVSHDGGWVVSGSKDRGVRFWDSRNAITQCVLQGHRNSGEFSSDFLRNLFFLLTFLFFHFFFLSDCGRYKSGKYFGYWRWGLASADMYVFDSTSLFFKEWLNSFSVVVVGSYSTIWTLFFFVVNLLKTDTYTTHEIVLIYALKGFRFLGICPMFHLSQRSSSYLLVSGRQDPSVFVLLAFQNFDLYYVTASASISSPQPVTIVGTRDKCSKNQRRQEGTWWPHQQNTIKRFLGCNIVIMRNIQFICIHLKKDSTCYLEYLVDFGQDCTAWR